MWCRVGGSFLLSWAIAGTVPEVDAGEWPQGVSEGAVHSWCIVGMTNYTPADASLSAW